eukprot:1150855-Pelagomonas_calceolata.AAC.2
MGSGWENRCSASAPCLVVGGCKCEARACRSADVPWREDQRLWLQLKRPRAFRKLKLLKGGT